MVPSPTASGTAQPAAPEIFSKSGAFNGTGISISAPPDGSNGAWLFFQDFTGDIKYMTANEIGAWQEIKSLGLHDVANATALQALSYKPQGSEVVGDPSNSDSADSDMNSRCICSIVTGQEPCGMSYSPIKPMDGILGLLGIKTGDCLQAEALGYKLSGVSTRWAELVILGAASVFLLAVSMEESTNMHMMCCQVRGTKASPSLTQMAMQG